MNRLRIQRRLVTCNLSLVTGDLQRSGPSVRQSPVTSYQLPVTSLMGVHEPPWFRVPMRVRFMGSMREMLRGIPTLSSLCGEEREN